MSNSPKLDIHNEYTSLLHIFELKSYEQLFTKCELLQKKYNIIEGNIKFSVVDLKNFDEHFSECVEHYEIGSTIMKFRVCDFMEQLNA